MAKKSHSDSLSQVLADSLREMREHAGITQVRMGNLLDRSQRSVSHIEFGTTRLDFVQVMEWCDVCGVDIVDFARRMKSLREKRGRGGGTKRE